MGTNGFSQELQAGSISANHCPFFYILRLKTETPGDQPVVWPSATLATAKRENWGTITNAAKGKIQPAASWRTV